MTPLNNITYSIITMRKYDHTLLHIKISDLYSSVECSDGVDNLGNFIPRENLVKRKADFLSAHRQKQTAPMRNRNLFLKNKLIF